MWSKQQLDRVDSKSNSNQESSSALSLAALVSGHVLPKTESQLSEQDFQSVTLIFQVAAASLQMTFPTDGQKHFTSTCLLRYPLCLFIHQATTPHSPGFDPGFEE